MSNCNCPSCSVEAHKRVLSVTEIKQMLHSIAERLGEDPSNVMRPRFLNEYYMLDLVKTIEEGRFHIALSTMRYLVNIKQNLLCLK